MKKLFSSIAAALVLLSFSAVAFAADAAKNNVEKKHAKKDKKAKKEMNKEKTAPGTK